MVRFMKGSKNENLMKLVREYLHFHEDYDEDEENDSILPQVKIILDIGEDGNTHDTIQDHSRKCFMDNTYQENALFFQMAQTKHQHLFYYSNCSIAKKITFCPYIL